MDNLNRGEIVRNGYQTAPHDLYLIIGTTSRKTGPYSTTTYYRCHPIYQGKLLTTVSLFNKNDNKLKRVGHININKIISDAIKEAMR